MAERCRCARAGLEAGKTSIRAAYADAAASDYIGGRLTRVGPRSGPGLEFALYGTVTPGFPEVSGGGTVLVVTSDGADGWYIGGQFTHLGGIPRNKLVRVLGTP